MSTKFGLLIDFDLLKAVTSRNTKREVVFSGRGRHLEKWIWRDISAVDAPIWTKFDRLMQNKMQITGKWSRSEPEVEFQYGGRLFFPNQKSLFFSHKLIYVDHWCRRNLVCWYILTFWGLLVNCGTSRNEDVLLEKWRGSKAGDQALRC